jgi:large subunit ribosomal protein L10
MLKRAQKEAIVDSIKADIDKAKAIFLTNLIGVKSSDAVAIRKSVRDVQGKVVITRNTLISRAGVGTSVEALLKDLKGPHAIAFAYEDAAAVAKCLKKASEDHEVVEFKGGMLDGQTLSIPEIKRLADLPSRDEMLGTLLATFNAPISALARVLNAIREQKEEGGTVAASAPAETESQE